jgi:hypothetical protein
VISRPFVWWAGNYPARVTILNSSGADIASVTLTSGRQQVVLGPLLSGVAKTTQLDAGAVVTIRTPSATWTSPDPLTPGGALLVYVMPGGRIQPHRRR